MKNIFKPLGLAAAVAAVTAGYAGVASAQGPATARAVGNLGDLAIVPYYTVQGDWITGVHIINSSDQTQVVKLRIRRASDSADALDFNLIMSPFDEWTGFLADEADGTIVWSTTDNTCTAPLRANGRFPMPDIFREGAEEGYIEVISMGAATDEDQPIAVGAKHDSDGVPFDCESVASNFFANGTSSQAGVADSDFTYQAVDEADDYNGPSWCQDDEGASLCNNDYEDGGNALKVSYFFRDATAGTEFGGNAVHISDFSDDAWMSNQELGLLSGDTTGFDYPDLNGGVLGYSDTRGLFNVLRQPDLLGVTSILNDWSVNQALNVSTDWVVTMPGQYTMVDYVVARNYDIANCGRLDDPSTAGDSGVPLCNFRDIPVAAGSGTAVYDREEGEQTVEDGDLVISPAPPGENVTVLFPYEVNVIEWGGASTEPVLGSDYVVSGIDPVGDFGWATLSVNSTPKLATGGDANPNGQAICEYVPVPVANAVRYPATSGVVDYADPIAQEWPSPNTNEARPNTCIPASGSVPIIGFVAWQRSFPSNPDANYGRLIEHSFTSN